MNRPADNHQEDPWMTSDIQPFSFDNDEVDQLFRNEGISKIASASANSLKSTDTLQTAKPLLSIIPEKSLARILAADKTQSVSLEAIAQPDITLRKISLGQPYSLEQYKSLASKTSLLDAAISSGDGNAILIIILFLTKTLKQSLIQRLLVDRPDAVNVYIHYLYIRRRTNEITDILTMLGHSSAAAMKNLHIIIRNTTDPNRLLQKLENCYKTHFSMLPDCKETIFLQSYIKLLEWQLANKQKKKHEDLPLNSSILESLHYAYKHHCDSPDDFVTMSPTTLSQEHDVSLKLYQKITLQVKALRGCWDDIERLLIIKSMLGSTKLQTHLHTEDILKVLHKRNAPSAVLEKYLKFVDNTEKRLELAKKMSCHTMVIDMFMQQGNRTMLMDYKARLQPQSEEYFYVESVLRLPHVKWKS